MGGVTVCHLCNNDRKYCTFESKTEREQCLTLIVPTHSSRATASGYGNYPLTNHTEVQKPIS